MNDDKGTEGRKGSESSKVDPSDPPVWYQPESGQPGPREAEPAGETSGDRPPPDPAKGRSVPPRRPEGP